MRSGKLENICYLWGTGAMQVLIRLLSYSLEIPSSRYCTKSSVDTYRLHKVILRKNSYDVQSIDEERGL